jgi:hypothetical protein
MISTLSSTWNKTLKAAYNPLQPCGKYAPSALNIIKITIINDTQFCIHSFLMFLSVHNDYFFQQH